MNAQILVIGSGIAGLSIAWKAPQNTVIIATKSELADSNSSHAQGGIAAALGRDDTPELHIQDTIRAGDGLVRKEIATILANEIRERIPELDKFVGFEKKDGTFKMSREAVHSRARIVHVSDLTGKAVIDALAKVARKKASILENVMAVELIVEKKKCVGCLFLDRKTGKLFPVYAEKIVLATGGIGQLYEITSNPEVATGDGIALAYNAGAVLEDMEFVQFHPTLLHNSKPGFLISETLRGEGGLLKNNQGKTFMSRYHRDGDLAPRDVVSKFSVIEMRRTKSKCVWLDVTHLDSVYVKKRFPHIYSRCLSQGVDITKKGIPVSPGAHYLCGGIKTDKFGKTTLPGLYAAGECACTGLHGADRLASNSLAEGMVFGARIAKGIKKRERKASARAKIGFSKFKVSKKGNTKARKLRKQLQSIMWKDVGIIRSMKGLARAKKAVSRILKQAEQLIKSGMSRETLELRNMAVVALSIIEAALGRKESRGTHFLQEYPERDDKVWLAHRILVK